MGVPVLGPRVVRRALLARALPRHSNLGAGRCLRNARAAPLVIAGGGPRLLGGGASRTGQLQLQLARIELATFSVLG